VKTLVAAAVALSLVGSTARADEHRGGDAALGALSGAVVFGPIGAVAGAVVGYAAGPSIARSWGFRRSTATHRSRKAAPQEAGASVRDAQAAAAPAVPPSQAAPAPSAPAPAPAPQASSLPPVQSLE
jgi:hypothetical protein